MDQRPSLDDPIASLEAELAHHQAIVVSLQRQIQELRSRGDQVAEGLRVENKTRNNAGVDTTSTQPPRNTEEPEEVISSNYTSHLPEANPTAASNNTPPYPLTLREYTRYGRQLLLPPLSLRGQVALKHARVLIVGAGGLGCPAAGYLAGAGVGHLGFVDMDVVEEGNLHRQIAHAGRVGWNKARSLREWCFGINPLPTYTSYPYALTAANALRIFSAYTHVLDCSDNPQTRYLISDAAVLTGIPLISASALRFDGQLMVLNYPPAPPGALDDAQGKPKGGPCYRCVFPRPPPASAVLACEDGGILGPVVGVMGVLQALEAIKMIACTTAPSSENLDSASARVPLPFTPSLLLFSALNNPQFRSVKLRTRKAGCRACGGGDVEGAIRPLQGEDGELVLEDTYAWFCGGGQAVVPDLREGEVCTVTELAQAVRRGAAEEKEKKMGGEYALVDVRDANQFSLCALPGSLNWPIDVLNRSAPDSAVAGNIFPAMETLVRDTLPAGGTVFVTCRLGNDSKFAVAKMRGMAESWRAGLQERTERERWESVRFVHVTGGLRAWAREVDGTFPIY